jgi:dTMP kinase
LVRGTSKVPNGYIIGIEGIDAVGKNTQTRLLVKLLGRRGERPITMSFPDYGTPIGKEIKSFLTWRRKYPIELQHLLFAANRWEKSEEIKSHLEANEIIIVNRYTESNLAYGVANGLDIDWLSNLEKGKPRAILVILLDARPQSLSSRRPETNKDTNEKNSRLQARAQKVYRDLAHKRGWGVIDARGSVREVQAAIAGAVREALAKDRGTKI